MESAHKNEEPTKDSLFNFRVQSHDISKKLTVRGLVVLHVVQKEKEVVVNLRKNSLVTLLFRMLQCEDSL